MNAWLERIENTLSRRRLIRDRQGVVIAVSGGVDSMVLLHVLHALAPKHGWKLIVAHFNHQLRGKAADADERLVRATARRLKIPFLAGRADVRKLATETGQSLEMAARQARHEFLARCAQKTGTDSIALAHHAGDQVELFFLRLLRGAGGQGLGGMKWVSASPALSPIRLIRPLLDFSKTELENAARENQIPYSEDATNACLDIQRNRIRHELIPLLKTHYQGALEQTTLRTMDILEAEADLALTLAKKWLEQKRRPAFIRLPLAIQRQVIRLQLFELGGEAGFDLVEQLRTKVRPVSIGMDRVVWRDAAGTVYARKQSPEFQSKSLRIKVNRCGQAHFGLLDIDWRVENTPGIKLPSATQVEHFDADKVGEVIVLRHWKPGDRFQPIGAKAACKLQDLFTNLKVPREGRHERVVAESAGGGIFWVEGLRISGQFKLDKSTRRRLVWQWRTGIAPEEGASCAQKQVMVR